MTIAPTDPKPTATRLIWFAAIVLTLVTAARITLCLKTGAGLTHESGVLTGLGMDAAHGLLYRPLVSEIGYGGTRYGPLHVLLHGGLIKAGLAPIPAGHVITLVSIALLVVGIYLLLRTFDVAKSLAIPASVLFLAGASGQFATTSIRADLLPAALNVAGLVVIARGLRKSESEPCTVFAGIFFALAFIAKVTTVFGAMAAFFVLIFSDKRKAAIKLTAITAGIVIVGLVAIHFASHGQMLANFKACAAGGRKASIGEIINLAFTVLIDRDHFGLCLLLLAAASFALVPWKARFELPGIALLTTFAVTLSLFLTKGIDRNHLVDLQIMAVVFAIVQVGRGRIDSAVTGAVLSVISLAACVPLLYQLKADAHPRVKSYAALAKSAVGATHPILADHAMVPVAINQRPFLLDDFTLPAVRKAMSSVESDLYEKIDSAWFPLVILKHDPLGSDQVFTFGSQFAKKLLARYELVNQGEDMRVYKPKAMATTNPAGAAE